MTAYITGTSTRKVDDLVKAVGCEHGDIGIDVLADPAAYRRPYA